MYHHYRYYYSLLLSSAATDSKASRLQFSISEGMRFLQHQVVQSIKNQLLSKQESFCQKRPSELSWWENNLVFYNGRQVIQRKSRVIAETNAQEELGCIFPWIDLFASRLSHQVNRYFAWKPDAYCLAVDALQQLLLPQKLLYAFLPFILTNRLLRKIKNEKINQVILIASVWQALAHAWYPQLSSKCLANDPLSTGKERPDKKSIRTIPSTGNATLTCKQEDFRNIFSKLSAENCVKFTYDKLHK